MSGEWEMVIGLEVHCELHTATKLFCGCANEFGAEPNTHIYPVCLGLPGSLPVLNEQAVEYAMRIGEALHCTVQPSIFHRKNYFYPDMPKDYQVSQYDEPINTTGWLELPDDGATRIGITRAHMEEDTGKSSHVGETGRIHGASHSLVDYNRAGVPLVEIVSEPDIRTSEQAEAYVKELRAILLAADVSDARMEEGSMRVDANVSVRRSPDDEFGTRCEIKNLNSLRSLRRAIEYEARRQIDLIEAGDKVAQETRHWVEGEGRTVSGRSKEESHDYRYFPEPDLVPLRPSDGWKDEVRAALGPMPSARRARLASAVAAASSPADVALVVELGLDDLVAAAIDDGADARIAVNRATNEVATDLDAAASLDPKSFAAVVKMESTGELTPTQSKTVIAALLTPDGAKKDPRTIAGELGFEAMGADALEAAVDEAIAAHPGDFEDLKAGNQKVVGMFVGQVMKATGGKANGREVTAILRRRAGLA
jgi:aspartyl-tRNA(Asn)/glutamyl-tRNA(Gln) amidotransferase subunit B